MPPHVISRLTTLLPTGRTVPVDAWRRRHQALLGLLWFHVIALPLLGIFTGFDAAHSLAHLLPLLACAVAARLDRNVRRSSAVTALGLMLASAVLVHIEHGLIEMHFHFFVMIAALALYEDWLPFLVAFAFVLLHHGIMGVVNFSSVYSHPGNPWALAGLHAGFVAAAGAINVLTWRLNEDGRAEARAAAAEARRHDLRFRRAFDEAPIGMALVDGDGRLTQVNHRLCAMVGRDAGTLEGGEMALVGDLGPLAALRGSQHPRECRLATETGDEVWALCSASALGADSEDLSILQLVDITERKSAEATLMRDAVCDGVTGLPNRACFLERTHEALRRRPSRSPGPAVLYIDFDDFKLVNDSLGHASGDEMLVALAGRLVGAVREEDLVARLGGDEFAVLCEEIDSEAGARAIAGRIAQSLRPPVAISGHEVFAEASVGIALAGEDHLLPEALLHDADLAMYRAKTLGGGRAELFDAGMRRDVQRRLEIESDLRRAIDRDELRLEYQPQVSLVTGAIIGVEALMRWEHPREGRLSPAEFIPVAEATGIIRQLGAWALRRACAQLVEWDAEGIAPAGLTMAVNVSPRQLAADDLEDAVLAALESAGLDPTRLELEITESALVDEGDCAIAPLRRLHALGVKVAIDDFGVGATSISYLKRFDFVQALKIDRSYVSAVLEDAHDEAIIRSVVALAGAFDLSVVAEGVEHPAQLERVRELGCDSAQGFLFAKPLPAHEITELLRLPAGIADAPIDLPMAVAGYSLSVGPG